MARDTARGPDEKVDIEAARAVAEDFADLRTRKTAPSDEAKKQLAEAKAKARFVKDVKQEVQSAVRRSEDVAFMHEVVQPISEEEAAHAWDANAQLREIDQRDVAINQELLRRDGELYQYFIRCRKCYGHGIYLTRAVTDGEVLKDADWVSRYKPEAKTVWRNAIFCQMCLSIGLEHELDIEVLDYRKGLFRPAARWLRKVSKDPLVAAKEGSVRACELPLTSQNIIGTLADPA